MSTAPRVTIVTVTWRSAGTIGGFLAACPAGMPVIVVDNASPDETRAIARAQRPDAQIIENINNLGFGAACNIGLEAARTEFVLLANPDSRLSEAAIAALVAAAEAHPGHRLVAPLLLDAEGRPVRSWNAAQPRRRLLPRDRGAEPWPEGPVCVDFASGACLLLRGADRLRFDEHFFLFYEDDDLCARAGGALLEPTARVAHAGGRSSPPTLATTWRKARCMAWSRLRFTALHGGGAAAARREARARLLHHAGKAAGHALTLRIGKTVADLAGIAGTLAWLRGRPGH
ncbi:glycosyltransferase family 2 protein [Falsiroseomonas bella]|uniref:Glycosyltransferase family 2 protein n=1 Tax=Falsiroseomonas bella TaxID=2184016 RepID=A0A317FFZ8_9PROT|nr:glycosyltransferase [Falsiroseomonas bella]PWS38004.1 glycosyltransferase family 2 protein [Falsiroseomonas bella]